jgi:hypothetical protein
MRKLLLTITFVSAVLVSPTLSMNRANADQAGIDAINEKMDQLRAQAIENAKKQLETCKKALQEGFPDLANECFRDNREAWRDIREMQRDRFGR